MTFSKYLFCILLFICFHSTLLTAFPTTLRSAQCPVLLPEDQPVRQTFHDTPSLPHTFHSLDNTSVSPRIINGDPVAEGILPYLAAVMTSEFGRSYSFICTGALIAPTWVLTAAHCYSANRAYAVLVGVRNYADYEQFPANFVEVVDFIIPAQYDDNVVGHPDDLMLLRLKNEVPNTKSMKILDNTNGPQERSAARVAGYGRTYTATDDDIDDNAVFQVDIPIASMDLCRDVYTQTQPPTAVDPVKHVCAGYIDKSGRGGRNLCGSCQGDSGGALFQYDESGEPVIVGVVSAGVRCGSDLIPTLYVRAGAHINWLVEMVPDIERASSTITVFVGGRSVGSIVGAVIGTLLVIAFIILVVFFFRRKSSSAPAQAPHISGQPPMVQPFVVQPYSPAYSANTYPSPTSPQQGISYTPDGYAYTQPYMPSPTTPSMYPPQQPYQNPSTPPLYPYLNMDLEPAQNSSPPYLPYVPYPAAESQPIQYSVPSYADEVSPSVQQSSPQPTNFATFPQTTSSVVHNTPEQDIQPSPQNTATAPAPSSTTAPARNTRDVQDGGGGGRAEEEEGGVESLEGRDETGANVDADHLRPEPAPKADEDSTKTS